MRIVLYIVSAVVSLNLFGLFVSGWLFLMVLAGFFIVKALREAYTDNVLWGRRWENVYLVDDRIKIDLEVNAPQIAPLCIFVAEGNMVRSMKEATGKLAATKNRFFVPDKEYSTATWEAIKIQVVPIWPRSGEWVNESLEEYAARAAAVIMEDRRTRHENLKALAPQWYQLHHHKEQEALRY